MLNTDRKILQTINTQTSGSPIATVSAVLTFIAVILIARQMVIGQFIMAVSQMFWATHAYKTHQKALLIQSIVLWFIAVYAIYFWRQI